jgi:hypothetical protein
MAERVAPLCPPCVATLREMCRLGGRDRPDLCEIEAQYLLTGDPDLVGRAAALAPDLAWQAKRLLRAQGRLDWPGSSGGIS